MDISGSYTLNAPREQVWDALLDPDTLKRAVPGCQSLERTSGTEYTARIAVEVAGIRGIYDGALKVVDPQRPESLRLVVDGAGARGILHGDGVLRLETAANGATLVTYSGQAQLGGTIASIGMGVAGHEATRLITDFFSRLASTLPAYTPAVTAPTAATPDMVSTATAAPMSAPMDALQRTAPITPAPPPQPAPAEAMAAPATGSPPASEPPMAAPMPASAASPASPAMSATSSPAPTPAVTAARPAGILDIDSGQRAARTIWGALIVVIVVAAIIILYIVTR
jgi:carbon monoxide dehydrogenase subunit G